MVILAIVMLVTGMANLLDWSMKGGCWFYLPGPRLLRIVGIACVIALQVLAILTLLGRIPDYLFLCLFCGLGIADNLYCIGRRHSAPENPSMG